MKAIREKCISCFECVVLQSEKVEYRSVVETFSFFLISFVLGTAIRFNQIGNNFLVSLLVHLFLCSFSRSSVFLLSSPVMRSLKGFQGLCRLYERKRKESSLILIKW